MAEAGKEKPRPTEMDMEELATLVAQSPIRVREKLDEDAVGAYQEIYEAKTGELDKAYPILVKTSDGLIFAAGRHRVEAGMNAGLKAMKVRVYKVQGEEDGALMALNLALEENKAHGVRLTYKDARVVMQTMKMMGHPDWELSIRKLAPILGVSKATVQNIKDEINGDKASPSEEKPKKADPNEMTEENHASLGGKKVESQLKSLHAKVEALIWKADDDNIIQVRDALNDWIDLLNQEMESRGISLDDPNDGDED